jgi:ribosome-associated translation inhibitor RaiA
MLSFNQYLSESKEGKNLHAEHLEDAIINGGVKGTRVAINYIQALRDALAGNTKSKVTTSLKWDGSPSLFAGVDPRDGKFFVAKKGIFNKDPKVYKTPKDIDDDTSGDLNVKLKAALANFSSLGIKGIIQGDFLFAKADLKTVVIDGTKYITFHPNTIVYAVEADSALGKKIAKSEIGVVWHTLYTGNVLEDMKATFNVNITSGLKSSSKVWMTDALIKDFSGTVTMTAAETAFVTSKLSELGKIFNSTSANAMNSLSSNNDLLIRLSTYNNAKIRAGQKISNPDAHVNGLVDYINEYYNKERDKRKTPAAQAKVEEIRKGVLSYFTNNSKTDLVNIIKMMNLIVECKAILIQKLNSLSNLKTFLLTRDGYRVTGQEGFVVADHLGTNAYKIVDRLEFSYANFGGALRGWEK